MRFEELIEIVGDEPIFETSLLLAGDVDPADVQRQLSRWTNAGRIYQLRRGLYALAPPFQKVKPHPFLVANRTVKPSHVSLQSALAHYGLIPAVRAGHNQCDLAPARSLGRAAANVHLPSHQDRALPRLPSGGGEHRSACLRRLARESPARPGGGPRG